MIFQQAENASLPPMAFAAKNVEFVSEFFSKSEDLNNRGEIWTADIKGGIELENGYPVGLEPEELALEQQSFIRFVHEATEYDKKALGFLSVIFNGHEYHNEAKATAAYIVVRGASLNMGLGYWTDDGKYDLIAVDPEENRWLENARSTLPFDQLCEV